MAAVRLPSPSFLEAFLPVARASLLPSHHVREPAVRRLPLFPRLRLTIPEALRPIPSLLGSLWQGLSPAELWDGLLNAVPKKKTSHMKKRHRQLAGKALQDVTALNKCSACGRPKRAHVLCPYCVRNIRRWFSTGFKTREELKQDEERLYEEINEQRRVRGQEPLKSGSKEVEWAKYGKRTHQSFPSHKY